MSQALAGASGKPERSPNMSIKRKAVEGQGGRDNLGPWSISGSLGGVSRCAPSVVPEMAQLMQVRSYPFFSSTILQNVSRDSCHGTAAFSLMS